MQSGGTETSYASKEHHSGGFTDLGFGQEYRPSKKLSYVPQSDIESEREDPPTLNLDGISKDQLMAAIQSLKAKSYKYKNKYAEVNSVILKFYDLLKCMLIIHFIFL